MFFYNKERIDYAGNKNNWRDGKYAQFINWSSWRLLKRTKILNPSGTPKKSQIDKGNFNPDGTIKDYNGLKKDIENKL